MMHRVAVVWMVGCGIVGCGGESSGSSPAPTSKDAGADTQADTSDDVSTQDVASDTTNDAAEAGEDAHPDALPDAGACGAQEGICVPSTTDCTDQSGTPYPAGDPECVFDDGQARCCVPPSKQPTGDSCADHGGLCVAAPGACLKTGGVFGPFTADCSSFGPIALCCLPPSSCSQEELECCGDGFTMRPYCDRGVWKCLEDSGTPVPVGTCG